MLLPASLGAAPGCSRLTFTEVAAVSGLRFVHDPGAGPEHHLPATMGSGLAWLDADGDGYLDLYVVQSGPLPADGSARDRLFRNRGDGTFADVSAGAGIAPAAGHGCYGQGVTAADADGDGDTDLYLTCFGPDRLLLNRGDGTFTDATAASGLGDSGWSSSAAFADADGDGDLDLYVARYLDYPLDHDLFCGDLAAGRRDYCHPELFTGAGDRFYRNLGGGRFADATAAAGLTAPPGRGLGVVFADLDGDLRPDLYVANDLSPNLLFHNRGNGTFEDLSLLSGAALNADSEAEASMGIAVGDVDADGDADLLLTHFDVETNTLYRNLGDLQFEDVSAASGFGLPSFNLLGFGIGLADFDLDGDLDAYVANGHILEQPRREGVSHAMPDLLLAGDGHGHFVACPPPAGDLQVGRGLAVADYDNDGDADLAIQNSGGPLQLLRNEATGERWLGVRLQGRGPNTAAVGARVTLRLRAGTDGEATVRQVRWVLAGDSYQSSGDPRLLFGWPDGQQPVALEIAWPGGKVETFPVPATRRYLTLAEHP